MSIYTYHGLPPRDETWGIYQIRHFYANNVTSWPIDGGMREAQGPHITETEGWERFEIVFTPLVETVEYVDVRLGLTGAASGSVYFDDLSLTLE